MEIELFENNNGWEMKLLCMLSEGAVWQSKAQFCVNEINLPFR